MSHMGLVQERRQRREEREGIRFVDYCSRPYDVFPLRPEAPAQLSALIVEGTPSGLMGGAYKGIGIAERDGRAYGVCTVVDPKTKLSWRSPAAQSEVTPPPSLWVPLRTDVVSPELYALPLVRATQLAHALVARGQPLKYAAEKFQHEVALAVPVNEVVNIGLRELFQQDVWGRLRVR